MKISTRGHFTYGRIKLQKPPMAVDRATNVKPSRARKEAGAACMAEVDY